MKVRQVPSYVAHEAVNGFKEYLKDHQNPKNRLGHHIGTIVGVGGGVGAMILGVPPEIAIPAGTAAVYACAIPSHPIFEGGESATLKKIKEINSIRNAPAKLGKALFYVLCEPLMSLMAFTGVLRPVMRKMGLNPLGADKVETPAQQEVQQEVEVEKIEPYISDR